MVVGREEQVHSIWLLAALAQQVPADIVVTGSREGVPLTDAPLSATLHGRDEIEALALPMAADLLRLTPGVSVASTGPRGTQTQLRIRGAEANHSLLFVDGIRFNDPAAGNEARFELFALDTASRLEVVRGPQSALWGSEALGGVIAVETGGREGLDGIAEYGGLDSLRAGIGFGTSSGQLTMSGSAGWLRSGGIDSFGQGGEKDGFENRSAKLKAMLKPSADLEIGLVGHAIEGRSEYDGLDPVTFRRSDTLDTTDNRLVAARAWGTRRSDAWSLTLDTSILASTNRNALAGQELNRTAGRRVTLGGQISRRFGGHRVTAAIEHEREDFRARDQSFSGSTDQDRSRDLTAIVGEWQSEWSEQLVTDIALRHDRFSAFRDSTTIRASALFSPTAGWTLHGAWGEGIAQPTFYDLHGFFPGSFVGNPGLASESSSGWEAGVRWRGDRHTIGAVAFSHRLEDEIVDVFDPQTFIASTANVSQASRRRGIELDAGYGSPAARVSLNYTYLDASERQLARSSRLREVRRPRHSANLIVTGTSGRFVWGGSLAYVGSRRDTDFDLFPARVVRLGDYWLASLNLVFQVMPGLQAYARAENLLDSGYQDVVGYQTPGRTIHAGLRIRLDP